MLKLALAPNCKLWGLALLLAAWQPVAPLHAADVSATPKRVYVVPFSHLDFFWGGTREECLARGNRIIAKAIRIAQEHPEFRFLLEDEDFVENFVESHTGTKDLEDFKRLVRSGHIEISPKWAAGFQDLADGEILARNFIYGKRYAKELFGVDPPTAHLGDLPAYTPQYPQILKQARTPYMVMTRMGPPEHPLFYWKGLDGTQELVWFSFKGYGWGAKLGLADEITTAREQAITSDVNEIQANTKAPLFMHWGSDLYAPTDRLVENLGILGKRLPGIQFSFATPAEYFRSLGTPQGIPVLEGEIPSSWPNIVSSLPHMWPLVIPATATLETAEKFATINYALGYADYPEATFDFLWKKLIESTDHNHDGQGGLIGDQRKADYSRLSILRGGEILRDSLRNIAERVQIPKGGGQPIVIFNSEGWTRTDVVKTHVAVYGDVVPGRITDWRTGMRLVDENGTEVPVHVDQFLENISRTMDLSFVATDVPPLGYKTYYLRTAPNFPTLAPTATITMDAERDHKEPRRAAGADVMENDFYRISVDEATGRVELFDKDLKQSVVKDMEISALEERGGNYIGIEPLSGRTIYMVPDKVEIEENNGVRSTLLVRGHLADIPVAQRISLWKQLKRVDVENTVDWQKTRDLRIEQVIPYQIPNAKIEYGVPFGANDADNLMPNSGPHLADEITRESWLNARHIQDWVYAGGRDWGLTVATDHQFVRLDGHVLRGEMIRGTKFTSAKVMKGDQVDSNHYPPAGLYTFRYSISTAAGDWRKNKSYRAGRNFNNPLIGIGVVDEVSTKSLPPTHSFLPDHPETAVLSAVKKAGRDRSIILRWYETEGATGTIRTRWLGQNGTPEVLNLLEEPTPNQSPSTLKPYEIKTVRLAK